MKAQLAVTQVDMDVSAVVLLMESKSKGSDTETAAWRRRTDPQI